MDEVSIFTPHQSPVGASFPPLPLSASPTSPSAGGSLPQGEAFFMRSLRPSVGEGLAPPALKKLPAQRRLLMPPSDEGGGKTAGFDGGREKRPIVESPNFPPPQSAIWPTAPPVGEPCWCKSLPYASPNGGSGGQREPIGGAFPLRGRGTACGG